MTVHQVTMPCTIQISYNQGKEFAAKVNALFFETSALDATNVKKMFIELGEFST